MAAEISADTNGNPIESLPQIKAPPQWVLIIGIIGDVAGAALVVVAFLKICGPIGSIGFIAATAGGGVLALTSSGGLIWFAVKSCQEEKPQEPVPEIPPPITVDLIPSPPEISSEESSPRVPPSPSESSSEESSPRKTSPKDSPLPLEPEVPQASVGQKINMNSLPVFAKEAIAFAEDKALNYPFSEQEVFLFQDEHPGMASPDSRSLIQIATHFLDTEKKLMTLLNQKQAAGLDPWTDSEVSALQYDWIKLGFAFSIGALNELSIAQGRIANYSKETLTYDQLLEKENFYYRLAFFFLPRAYHRVRCGIFMVAPGNVIAPNNSYPLLFTQAGTFQSKSLALFNLYCKCARSLIPEIESRASLLTFFKFTTPDSGTSDFEIWPDAPPR